MRKAEKQQPGNRQQANDLLSAKTKNWLNAPLFELSGGVSYTRRGIVELTASPCTRAASLLHQACKRYNILTIQQLNHVGMKSLQRCHGIGERATWIAALILAEYGYSIDQWTRRSALNLNDRIRLAYSRTRKQKH